jgi:hypothetical protein
MRIGRWVLRTLVGVVAVAGPVVGLQSGVALAASPAGSPQVRTSTPVASVGERVYVTGTGWAPVGQTVLIQICGEDARDFSADCNQQNQYTAAIRTRGIFYGALVVKLPPTPCPCVFSVTTPGSFVGVDVPLTIVGAPDVPIPPQVVPATPVTLSAQVDTPSSVSSWFGGPKPVTLILSVSNRSSVRFRTPTYVVTVGHGPDPTGFVVGQPMAPLAAGATRVVRVPVTIPPFTFGHYTVHVEVTTGLGSATVAARTSTYPWGLVVVLAVLLFALVLEIVRRHRRRKARRLRQAALAAADGRLPRSAPGQMPGGPGAAWTPGYPPVVPPGPVPLPSPGYPPVAPPGPVPMPSPGAVPVAPPGPVPLPSPGAVPVAPPSDHSVGAR